MGELEQSALWSFRLGEISDVVSSGVPVLSGEGVGFAVPGTVAHRGAWRIVETETEIFGCIEAPVKGLEETAADVYRDLFRATSEWHLYRIWNFVPSINREVRGFENYRAFCLGRHEAFREYFGDNSACFMPAASAVGTEGHSLVTWFIGGKAPPRHVENPDQVPAYAYPEIYGPRPPSFSRATVVGRRVFVSGTSSIRGHETVAGGNVAAQVGVTLANLERVLEEAAPVSGGEVQEMNIYLRRAADLESVRALVEEKWKRGSGRLTFLRADICRAELDVEIETVFCVD